MIAVAIAAIAGSANLLANDQTGVNLLLQRSVEVRHRPSVVWPVIGVVAAGEEVVASAITPQSDPWLRIEQDGLEVGWIRAAETIAPVDELEASLPVTTAPPLWAFVRGATARMSDWAGGPEVTLSLGDPVLFPRNGPHGVIGRSADGTRLAVRMQRNWGAGEIIGNSWLPNPPVIVWFRAADMFLNDPRLTVKDLPIFVGNDTVLLPTVRHSGIQARQLPPANEWKWRSDGLLVGIGDKQGWRYDPVADDLKSVERPAGFAVLAPDARHVAVAVCNNWNESCQSDGHKVYDIVIVPTDGGTWSRSILTGSYPGGYKIGLEYDVGVWSPDSRFILVPRIRTGQETWGPVLEYSVVTLSGERYYLPRDCRWQWVWDGSLLDCLGDRYSAPFGRQLLQAGAVPSDSGMWLDGRSRLTYPWVPPQVPLWSEEHGSSTLDPLTGETTALQTQNSDRVMGRLSSHWDYRSPDGLHAWQYVGSRDSSPTVAWFDLSKGDAWTMRMPDDHAAYGSRAIVPVIATSKGMLWGSANDQGQVSLYISESVGEARLVSRFTQDIGWGDSHALAVYGLAGWSRETKQMTLIVREHDAPWPWRVGVDGLFTIGRGSWDGGAQIRVHDLDGRFVTAVRAPARISYLTGIRTDWSPDGQWLTIGGHPLGPFWRSSPE